MLYFILQFASLKNVLMLHVPVFLRDSKYTQIYNITSSSKRCSELVINKT